MYRRISLLHVALITLVLLLAFSFAAIAASVPRMSTDELNSRLGEADMIVLDARSSWHLGQSEVKILGSERVAPGAVAEWADNYSKDKTLVLYCA